ncbi:hypothetical protein NQZ68_007630, partial [Dissostichus eleginoides]
MHCLLRAILIEIVFLPLNISITKTLMSFFSFRPKDEHHRVFFQEHRHKDIVLSRFR